MPDDYLQRWRLIGLQPNHEALIRRLAVSESCALENQRPSRSIDWSVSERIDAWSEWANARDVDVIIIDAPILIDAVEAFIDSSQTMLCGTETRSCLRLVWSGLDRSRNDLLWANQWLAHGVITDPATAQSWVRNAVRNANTVPRPPHPFLRNRPQSII
jgi:hypothetical protein